MRDHTSGHRKISCLRLALFALAAPPLLFVMAVSSSIFSAFDTDILSKERVEKLDEAARYLDLDGYAELEKKAIEKLGFDPRGNHSHIESGVKELLCEQIYIDNGKDPREVTPFIKTNYGYPDICKRSEHWFR